MMPHWLSTVTRMGPLGKACKTCAAESGFLMVSRMGPLEKVCKTCTAVSGLPELAVAAITVTTSD